MNTYNVEVQTVFALLLQVRCHGVEVVGRPDGHHDIGHSVADVLWADGGEARGIPHARPSRGGIWGHEASYLHTQKKNNKPSFMFWTLMLGNSPSILSAHLIEYYYRALQSILTFKHCS
uniref:Secreted protein n=1 Tax=Electrophorus electricus TaxID=8005 RepID=A0AAY5EFB2_ELEEL